MNFRLTYRMLLILTLTGLAFAQGGKPTGGSGGASSTPGPNRTPTMNPPTLNAPDPTLDRRVYLTGKVVLDDGTQLTESANILTICRGRKQTVTHTDSHGGFGFELGDRIGAMAAGIGQADVDSPASPTSRGVGGSQREWRECELLAELPGFTSQPIDLSSRLSTLETADIGRLVLHRVGQVEGLTLSATSAMAPRDAQKAYEKARNKLGKEKWEEAQQLLTKAVEMYPKYAVAWFDLGRIQLHNNDAVQARHSFEQSISADPKYVNPYRGLAELDTQQQKWQELVTVTNQVVALNPVNFPDAWLRNALGNYYLRNLVDAEKSARQGLKMDDQHQYPKLEYLLGLILIQKHEYQEAASHIQNYMKVAKEPSEIAQAQNQLTEITRITASAGTPAAAEKK
jgi:Tfp pilus assembly protein PilF